MSQILKGRVVSGAKEGAYFISIYADKLEKLLDFRPFPGTLNIEVNAPFIQPKRAKFIASFTVKGKGYGAVWCYPCIMLNTKGYVMIPEKSRHSPNIVEIISPACLKTKLNLKNGDYVEVEVDEARD
jgi:riboflavin kinase